MKMNKRAQGLSLNMVIVAAIALIILVIIVAIFTGNLGRFGVGVSACSTKSGVCKESCVEGETAIIAKCPENGQDESLTKCCIVVS